MSAFERKLDSIVGTAGSDSKQLGNLFKGVIRSVVDLKFTPTVCGAKAVLIQLTQ